MWYYEEDRYDTVGKTWCYQAAMYIVELLGIEPFIFYVIYLKAAILRHACVVRSNALNVGALNLLNWLNRA
jgi:hypothetical protein